MTAKTVCLRMLLKPKTRGYAVEGATSSLSEMCLPGFNVTRFLDTLSLYFEYKFTLSQSPNQAFRSTINCVAPTSPR